MMTRYVAIAVTTSVVVDKGVDPGTQWVNR